MKADWFSIFLVIYLAYLLTGCSQSDAPNTAESPSQPMVGTAVIVETQMVTVMPTQKDDMPKDPPFLIPTNPGLPALIERARANLAQRLSIPASQIKVMETKEVFWPDNSLGCPQPGIAYAQIPVPGYVILLMHAGSAFEYHASIHADIVYCEHPAPPVSGSPTSLDPFPIAPP